MQSCWLTVLDLNLDDDEFSLPSKKKKKKKKTVVIDDGTEGAAGKACKIVVVADDRIDAGDGKERAAWADSDRDYTYHELLERVFDIMRAKNPELAAGEKRRFKMKPPQVLVHVCHARAHGGH